MTLTPDAMALTVGRALLAGTGVELVTSSEALPPTDHNLKTIMTKLEKDIKTMEDATARSKAVLANLETLIKARNGQ